MCLKKKNPTVEPQVVLPNNNLGNPAGNAEAGQVQAQNFALANDDNADDGLEPIDLGEELNQEPHNDDGLVNQEATS